ncbi:MAG: acyl-CoA dehydrogenase family protein [Myxococcota bacterium]
MNRSKINWVERARALVPQLAEEAASTDREGRFVTGSHALLAKEGFLSALVPTELGGGGARYGEAVGMLRELARGCGSTALALSMHTHLVAATVWKHIHGKPGEKLLRRVADEDLVLVSTGAGDWLQSNGRAERVNGGFRVYGEKHFASGLPVGSLAITSIAYDCPDEGPSVLHFPLPLAADGVKTLNNWDSHGMRGTGSHSLLIDGAFVPDAAIALKRPREGWHPVWNVVLTVAPALYMAPYMGVAEAAAELVRARSATDIDEVTLLQLGEMENRLTGAQLALDALVDLARDFDFSPDTARAGRCLTAKTLVAQGCLAAVEKAMEIAGGAGYLRGRGLERLLRDVRGAPYHPLPEKRQQVIAGRLSLGLSPV